MQVVALVGSHETRARLRDALAGGGTLSVCFASEDLPRLVREQNADAVIVEPRDAANVSALHSVRSIRRQWPYVAIAIFCRLEPESTRDLVQLIKAGGDEVILHGYDDPGVWLNRRQRTVQWRKAALAMLERVSPFLSGDARLLMGYCLEIAPQAPSVTGAALALGVHRKTLVNRFAAVGLPSPRILVSWSRLLVALELLDHSGRSLESVAHAMGFGSGAALRKMCLRYTGLRTQELRILGGAQHAAELFLTQLGASVNPFCAIAS